MVEKVFGWGLAVLIQYRSVTDTQPASHVAVAITLNAQLGVEPKNRTTHLCKCNGVADLKHASHHCVTMPNLVVLR